MPTPAENEAQAREAYAAFAQGDLDKVKAIFHPDIVWHVEGTSPMAGHYKGIAEVLDFFGRIFTETNGTFRNTIDEVIATEDTVVVIAQVNAERGGKTIDAKQVAVYRNDADGRVTDASFYGDDTTQFDDFFS
jgi:ketosteroid isomerase-like protein